MDSVSAAMATVNPAAFLGLEREIGQIAAGYRADFVLLDEELRVTQTWIAGEGSISS